MRSLVISLLILLMAACGGGGGGAPAAPAPAPAFDRPLIRDSFEDQTFFQALPAAGTASFTGTAKLALPLAGAAPQVYAGDLAMQVSFGAAAAPVTGTISTLQAGGPPLDGVLAIDRGVIYADPVQRDDWRFTAQIAGPLAQNSARVQVQAELSGEFFGATGAISEGVIYGILIDQSRPVASFEQPETDIFHGSFEASTNDL